MESHKTFSSDEKNFLTVPDENIAQKKKNSIPETSNKDRKPMINQDDSTSSKKKWSLKSTYLVQYEFPELDEWEVIMKEKSESQFLNIHKMRMLVFNTYYSYFVMLAILYALFGSNIKFLFFNKKADVVFDIFNYIVMVIFFLDFIFNIWIRIDYLASFYFWMDIASFGLLFLDLS